MQIRKISERGTKFDGFHLLFTNPRTRVDRRLGHIVEVYDLKNHKERKSRTQWWYEGEENLVARIDVLELVEDHAKENQLIDQYTVVVDDNYTHDLGDGTIVVGQRLAKSQTGVNPELHSISRKIDVEISYFDLWYYSASNGEIYYQFRIGGKHLKVEKDRWDTSFRAFYVREWFRMKGVPKKKDKITKVVYGKSLKRWQL